MAPYFSIDVEPALKLVKIEMAGFFQLADIAAFDAARNDVHRELRCGPNQHLTLVDIRGMLIQSQEAVAAFRSILTNPQYTSRRIAIIVSKSLARMQIERAAAGRNVGFFDEDTVAARQWLFAD